MKKQNKNKTGGQAGEDWVAIKVIPPCHSVRVLGRGAHGQKQFVTVREGMIYSARASSQQMVAEIKFVKQGRLNGVATTQGGRRSAGRRGCEEA